MTINYSAYEQGRIIEQIGNLPWTAIMVPIMCLRSIAHDIF